MTYDATERRPKPNTPLFQCVSALQPHPRSTKIDTWVLSNFKSAPTHITTEPLTTDYRERAIEELASTRVFGHAGQRELFENASIISSCPLPLLSDDGLPSLHEL